MQGIAIGDERDVRAFTTDTSLPEGYFEVLRDHRSRLSTIVLRLGLHEDRESTGAHRCAKETRSVVGKARVHNTSPGEGGQYRLDIL